MIRLPDAHRMVIATSLGSRGLFVRFADDREGWIPTSALMLPAEPREVRLPDPGGVQIHLHAEGDGAKPDPVVLDANFLRSFTEEAEGGRGKRGKKSSPPGGSLPDRLRAFREQAGVSQDELARRAGVSRSTLARIEGGGQAPRSPTIKALARALEISPGWLMG